MQKAWKTLSQKVLLKHKRLIVYEDEVELPNGHKTDYIHFGKAQDGATLIAINQDKKILVQKEYSYPPNKWLYQFPGGAVNKDEAIEAGGLRELAEEAGYTGNLRNIGHYYTDNRKKRDLMHVFVVTDLKKVSAKRDAEEDFETFWLTEKEINNLIATDKVVNYSMLAAWALFNAG